MRAFLPKQSQPQQRDSSVVTRPASTAARPTHLVAGSAVTGATRFLHDFGRLPGNPALLADAAGALPVGPAGDVSEREADQVAERVMGTQAQPRHDGALDGQWSGGLRQAPQPAAIDPLLRSPGQPLDPAARTFMESRFRHDFSRVRIHDGRDADHAAMAYDARAFTLGRHIAFGTPAAGGGKNE